MPSIELRFYEELNDYLPETLRKRAYVRDVPENSTVRAIIGAEGIPPEAIELLLADGRSVGFDYIPRQGERLAVYPVFEAFDLGELRQIHDRPLRQPRFVADAHLGKLAESLRMLGFDTLYRNDFSDDELVRLSGTEQRILLSRDRGLLQRQAVERGYFVTGIRPGEQLLEVLEHFDLYGLMRPLNRCIKCNSALKSVPKEEVAERLPPGVARRLTEFWRCTGCGRIYWKGSHYDRMRRRIAALRRRRTKQRDTG